MFAVCLPVKDLADTAMRHPELPGDDAGPDPGRRHLDDLEPDVVGQGASVDVDSPQLIYTALAPRGSHACRRK